MNTAELFDRLALAGVRRDLYRNIVSLRSSQDLFDDLSDDPAEWALAQKVEGDAKPPPFRSPTPVLHRPLEDDAYVELARHARVGDEAEAPLLPSGTTSSRACCAPSRSSAARSASAWASASTTPTRRPT